jgi:hypothetical protein
MEAYEDSRYIFDRVGWYFFCNQLDGHHYGAAMVFYKNLNGQWAQIENLVMQVIEDSILLVVYFL